MPICATHEQKAGRKGMSTTVRKAAHQLALMKLTIELVHTASITYFGDDNFSSNCGDVLLGMSVGVGQLQGKPLSVSKLSQVSGMPRVTVMRRLQDMESRGLVERDIKGFYRLPAANMNTPEVMRSVASLSRCVRQASTALSKTDTG